MSVYRSQGKREVFAESWHVSSWDKRAVKMKRALSKIGRGLFKTIIFIIDTLDSIWEAAGGFIIFLFFIGVIGTFCYYADKNEKKQMQETPCSEFLNKPMEKAPLRCIKEYSK